MNAFDFIMFDKHLYDTIYDDNCFIEKDLLFSLSNEYKLYPDMMISNFAQDAWCYYIFTKEMMDTLRSIEITMTKEAEKYDAFCKYPYYRLRGKPITPEQAEEVILNTEYRDRTALIALRTIAAYDGTVGANSCLTKWPNIYELFCDTLRLKLDFPYLEYIAVITGWPEIPNCNRSERYPFVYGEYNDYTDTVCQAELHEDNIEFGIWSHDNKIEFIDPSSTIKVYRQYDSLYDDSSLKTFLRIHGSSSFDYDRELCKHINIHKYDDEEYDQ